MSTMTDATTGTVEVPAHLFKRALTALTPLAATAKLGAPILEGIHLHEHNGRLLAEATDRYVAGVVDLGPCSVDGHAVVIPTDQAKMMATAIRRKDAGSSVVVTFGEDHARLNVGAQVFMVMRDAHWPAENYPKLDGMFRATLPAVAAVKGSCDLEQDFVFDMRKMLQFKAACPRETNILRTARGWTVMDPDFPEFVGLLMPMKAPTGLPYELASAWRQTLA